MFTGIIEGLGTIRDIRNTGKGAQFTIESDFDMEGLKIGDSIAVNGACLTAVSIDRRRFRVDVSPETIRKTIFSKASPGTRVNLERALRFSDRIDGHLVSGHIDGTGIVKSIRNEDNAVIYTFEVPESLADYMISKGSVAVDGISLTINGCSRTNFEVSIIPHTAKITTIGLRKVGDAVNIETDMIGKYVEKFVSRTNDDKRSMQKDCGIDMAFLAKTGFL